MAMPNKVAVQNGLITSIWAILDLVLYLTVVSPFETISLSVILIVTVVQ